MTPKEYRKRREILANKVVEGIILCIANKVLPRNYAANSLPFRQDSTFLYYTGIDVPELIFIIDCNRGETILAGYEPTIEDAVWSGPQTSLKELAERAGITQTLSFDQLNNKIKRYRSDHCKIHYLPPYTAEKKILFSELLDRPIQKVTEEVSEILIDAVIEQRSIKSVSEINEIESVLNLVTGPMHESAMKMAVEGNYEHQVVAEMYRIAKVKNLDFAFPVICSVHGEVLHNESYINKLQNGQLLLVDSGVESINHYASDITRTTPVGGKFTLQQREIYEIVLETQDQAIKSLKPGIRYLDIHLNAAKNIANGLKMLGLMQGDVDEAVRAGAHALFFPHGLGHMMGLDVHDMEDLGENRVGYDKYTTRSKQFGTAYLRLARALKHGYVLTVEPGIYFIPALIDQWQAQGKYKDFINYDTVKKYLKFGGIRIEDNIVITDSGSRILGNPIKKNPEEIEGLFQNS
jgi:Xaa-Pro aminopeptidase